MNSFSLFNGTSKMLTLAGETVNAIRFNFDVKNENIIEAFKELKVRFILFYPNGKDEMENNGLNEWSEKIIKTIEEKNNTSYNNGTPR